MHVKPTKKYRYGTCQFCHSPTKERKAKYCRPCFWNPIKRFWEKVTKTPTCWIWQKPSHEFGYGNVRLNKRTINTHRASWIIHNGPIPKGMFVLHHCDVAACVNPDHLFLGTQADNMRDKIQKGRGAQGEMMVRNKLSEQQVFEIRRLYKFNSREFGQNALARMFHISQANIGYVVSRKTWKHLEK